MDYLDMLAKLGIGNAHPGGFAATIRQLEQEPLPAQSRILEVGCGTGRTACYLASQGHRVTGIDIRPEMIVKAQQRAEHERASVEFVEGDACALPFADETFDVVFVESVTIFTDASRALSEYFRVLRKGGRLVDREMIRRNPAPEEINEEIIRFYQIPSLREVRDWSALAQAAGFQEIRIEGPNEFPRVNEDLLAFPDPFQQADDGALLDAALWDVVGQYNRIMDRYAEYVGFMIMTGSRG